MTNLYFVRHAQPEYAVHENALRPLTPKGMADTALVTHYLQDKNIEAVVSSPYLRATQTLRPFAEAAGLFIQCEDGLRERTICGDTWIEDFDSFAKRQWADFTYKEPGGESLAEVQARNMAVVNQLLQEYADKAVAIGTHGTALSTVLHYYDNSFGYDGFAAFRRITPYVVRLTFEGCALCGTQHIDLFKL